MKTITVELTAEQIALLDGALNIAGARLKAYRGDRAKSASNALHEGLRNAQAAAKEASA